MVAKTRKVVKSKPQEVKEQKVEDTKKETK